MLQRSRLVLALSLVTVGRGAWPQPRPGAPAADASIPDGGTIPEDAPIPDDADLTSRWAPVTAAQRAAAGVARAVLPAATWRLGSRWVSVGAFAIDRTEVTVGAWRRCMAAGSCPTLSDPLAAMTRDGMPVVNVTHAQAARYCAFAGARLPTDAEWSLAAQGVEGRRSPWGTRPASCALARTSGCGDGATTAGATPGGASPEGALDLVGNVAEWVHDRAGPPPVVRGVARDPTGPAEGSRRWVRGGSFRTPDGEASGLWRQAIDALEARVDVGFRCVRGL
ncbi:MAG: SUMF1/EgtB/PvdO family nonheme iron enzyme [Deltaproteobacteria bacterium]|nr:SUMF1/EgtB/PvdO family nonheme iron enzyme [Myxococcales bacterium]MDP3213568.1 SUMF1/EgtB/PvdO family nonheme iron enzyme [Deltaproteobacteria bacterium]